MVINMTLVHTDVWRATSNLYLPQLVLQCGAALVQCSAGAVASLLKRLPITVLTIRAGLGCRTAVQLHRQR
jgi:hypothetical protein